MEPPGDAGREVPHGRSGDHLRLQGDVQLAAEGSEGGGDRIGHQRMFIAILLRPQQFGTGRLLIGKRVARTGARQRIAHHRHLAARYQQLGARAKQGLPLRQRDLEHIGARILGQQRAIGVCGGGLLCALHIDGARQHHFLELPLAKLLQRCPHRPLIVG